jgi:murein DD-endopeptidase MepM/ murein hydrolase activator NlpD
MATTAKAEPAKAAPAPVQTAKAEPAKPVQTPKAAPAQPAPQAVAQKPAEPVKVAAIETKPVAAPAPAPVAAAPQPQPQPAKAASIEETGSLPKEPTADFRWPARGRVIAGFGANGGNEGINIAVPEGTPVKAAEAGTVTYAGNEVRGYGNLVLIKHDNGYISAYAHNGELSVKRGERVTRGQVVAKSGQTGNVTSPQLHFEIRKGQTPVDPLSYLSGN